MSSTSIPYIKIEDKINFSYLEKSLPALIVEGTTDIKVYGKLLTKSKLDWKKVDLVVASGKSEILKIVKTRLPFKYVALVDSDYDRFLGKCLSNEELIYTHYYTMENYLTEPEVVHYTIEDMKSIFSESINAKQVLDEALSMIGPYVEACLIKLNQSWPIELEKCSILSDNMWDKTNKRVCAQKIKSYLVAELNTKEINVTEEDLSDLKIPDWKDKAFLVVNGKRLFEALFILFNKYFPATMKGRKHSVFSDDLCKNLFKSPLSKELIETIDTKLLQLIS